MDIHPISLNYDDRNLEKEFRHDYTNKSIKQVRIAILLPIVIYLLSDIMGRLFNSERLLEISSWLKYGIFTPILLLIFAASYRKNSPQIIQLILVIVCLIMAISFPMIIGTALIFADKGVIHNNSDYLLLAINTILILVTVSAYTATRLLFIYAIPVALVILGIYNVIALFLIKPTLSIIIVTSNFQLLIANLIGGFAGYLMEFYIRRDFLKSSILELEQEKSERLLLNILPGTIASRLKESNNTIADSFAEVTILFADIVGFTKLSTKVSPVELVELLNHVFSAFDELAEKHGLEKIKTIGDAYMVVGGIPEPRVDHAEAIAEMALAMQAEIIKINQTTEQDFSMRIGINSGEVVAGVIGKKKFIYDLWGDAVNTASRMESHGIPNMIHVTEETYQLLVDKYVFTDRGMIEVKGKGTMQTYILQHRLHTSTETLP